MPPFSIKREGIPRGRATDRADAKLLRGARIDLAVVMARDEHADVEVEDAGEGQHEMLPVPHGEDDRGKVNVFAIGLGRIEGEPTGQVDQAEIGRGQACRRALDLRRAQQPAGQRLTWRFRRHAADDGGFRLGGCGLCRRLRGRRARALFDGLIHSPSF